MLHFVAESLFVIVILANCLVSCTGGSTEAEKPAEDLQAKKMLQGVWLGEDDVVSMSVTGDTIVYSDSTMAPVAFAIIQDSLVIYGSKETHYEIVKQTEHIFQFRNHVGDVVKLMKSDNPEDAASFKRNQPLRINQNELIKRDTVAVVGDHKYHVYVQVNPSTYKVIRSSYNQDGVMVDNVYYDNIINICVYDGGKRLFSRDFHKQDFVKQVPESFISQSILSDIEVDMINDNGVSLTAYLCMPDTPTSYLVTMTVSEKGKLGMKVAN